MDKAGQHGNRRKHRSEVEFEVLSLCPVEFSTCASLTKRMELLNFPVIPKCLTENFSDFLITFFLRIEKYVPFPLPKDVCVRGSSEVCSIWKSQKQVIIC